MADTTEKIRRRYDRMAPFFDKMDRMVTDKHRAELIRRAHGEVLEAGVGTGANLKFYPVDVNVTAIDFSPRMLSYAQERVKECRANVRLLQMDVQHLQFDDNTFDTVVSTCVLCSVPDPIAGLREIHRVLKPSGQLLMIEHMLSDHIPIALMLHMLNPFTVRLTGANVNRRTMDNLRMAGFTIQEMQCIALSDMFRLIVAKPNK
ncbi:class I SAM-dependent methyltransferase [Alicyclobacillus macrosporangiidus]|uniref:Methyltransferase domain-containing protein n=1 Tax=Alicyclobacillus macrosporangiidus TaxID=392015 RepID=A0A1I7L871_9BACL|nr:class I SAM-dependent methyltransferase [Alicyclobacillus macrosporangiidus]SFV05921.1 Methyltransferase domain-containing protein [Alicyclobacillus macrosporangiidus]